MTESTESRVAEIEELGASALIPIDELDLPPDEPTVKTSMFDAVVPEDVEDETETVTLRRSPRPTPTAPASRLRPVILPPPPKLPSLKSLKPKPASLPPPPRVPPPRAERVRRPASLPPLRMPPPRAIDSEPTVPRARMKSDPDRRDSWAPVVRPVRPRSRRWPRVSPALAGALLGVAVFLCALAMAKALSPTASAATSTGEALMVTVAGPGGRAVAYPRIFVDGVLRCEASPCRVDGLAEGVVLVSVQAAGFAPTTARAVPVIRGSLSAVHVELGLDSAGPASVTVAPEPAPAVATQPQPISPEEMPKLAPKPKAPAPARLSLNSIPASAVVVDGRPLGHTPVVGVSVAPGAHQVVFLHPEHGRQVRSVNVTAGASETVAVRF